MSLAPRADNGKITVPDILSRKSHSQAGFPDRKPKDHLRDCVRLSHRAPARRRGSGNSAGLAIRSAWPCWGYDSTLPVTLDEMVHHTRAVRRATRRALVVADMPYGSFHISLDESVTPMPCVW